MPTLLQVAQLGHPILRKKAQEIEDIHHPDLQNLINDMIATCRDVDGVGISAPQVYHSVDLFVIASKPNARYPHAPNMEPMAIINPRIEGVSGEFEEGWEGCLSIPGLRGSVMRDTWVVASFTDKDGRNQQRKFEGFIARVFMHEFDHLEGVLFVDHNNSRSLMLESEFQKRIVPTLVK